MMIERAKMPSFDVIRVTNLVESSLRGVVEESNGCGWRLEKVK